MESKQLLPLREVPNSQDNYSFQEDEWTDGSSYSSYSDSDSTIPDWEPYVDDPSGQLVYIDCHPFVTHNKEHKKLTEQPEPFSKTQLRRSSRGKFLRLIRRRESQRRSKKVQKPIEEGIEVNTQKVKFQDFQEGEKKIVTLEIDSENRYNLSSDKSLAESLLGLVVSPLSDGNRVMIAGFSYDSKAKHERNIKIGDWLKSINDIEVNVQNLDDILQKFINHMEVLLTLQRVAAREVTKDPPINELNLESEFVSELLNKNNENEELLCQSFCKHPIGVVYINTEKLNENNEANEDIIYCFPKPIKKNVLCTSRGMFITLTHLLQDITNKQTKTSSVLYNNRMAHIVYTQLDNKLLLFMLPNDRVSLIELSLINANLIRFFEFSFGTLDKCFTLQTCLKPVDRLFSRYFARVLGGHNWTTMRQFLEAQNSLDTSFNVDNGFFEEVMSVVPTLNLHDDAMMQIDDALAELEASDYREWNEDPLDCRRLFTVLGSALFHSGYLLASHLIYDDLVDVYCFCKLQGLIHLSRTEPVKSLVLWREVFPRSCTQSQVGYTKILEGRRYLLVVGTGKDFLVVIMETGGCTEQAEENMGPDAFYVEEAQATLAHIQELGLNVVAERSLLSSGGFQIATPFSLINKRKTDLIGTLNFSKSGSAMISREANSNQRKNEVTSILKRRSSEQNVANISPEDAYDAHSQGSGSLGTSERLSEISDDSNGKHRKVKYDSNDEDSDLDDFADGSQISSSSLDLSEVRQSLLFESDYSPIQLTSGAHNVLFHFVHFDTTEGIFVSPLEPAMTSQTYNLILKNYNRCCQNIHRVFQNTLRFKNMPAQDVAKSLMNKSLIAIKEHGILFECPCIDEKDSNKRNKITYWVMGRLFYMPHPKEVYVCYQDIIPQNLIELAFRINLNNCI